MESMLKYNKAGGKVLKGLDNRRKDEAALFRG
jgi:GH24 family phage-related lysozyme (muramidase)